MYLGAIMKILNVFHFPASPDWNSLAGAGRADDGRRSHAILTEPPVRPQEVKFALLGRILQRYNFSLVNK